MLKFGLLLFLCIFHHNTWSQSIQPIANPRALVELFTSQGCSSCPNAHKIIENFFLDTTFAKDSVLFLSFHVDYWDDLGWIDTFSKSQFTQRQKKYKELLNADGVYTPQFIVNGRSGFSGNNEPRLHRELNAINSSSKLMITGLKLTELKVEDGKLIFSYLVDGNAENKVIQAAIISNSDTTIINDGENKGLTLSSRNNVLNLFQLPLKSVGSRAFVIIPKDTEPVNLKFVLWVQDTNDAQVLDILLFNIPD